MLDWLKEIIVQCWELLLPVHVLDQYQAGVVLRFGKYNRTRGPGLVWKWPLAERVLEATVCVTTHRCEQQSLTSKDLKEVVIRAIVKYRIRDPKAYLLEIWDQQDALEDVASGAVRAAVESNDFKDLILGDGWERDVLERVRRETVKYGFWVERITYADLARMKSMRLMLPFHTAVPK